MLRTQTCRAGFTLIELLFVIAIIGVLSTTAIGMLRVYKVRSMRAEAMTNVAAIAKLENGYFGENGSYPPAAQVPLLAPGQKQNWDAAAALAFGTIGFSTEGSVFYVYEVNSPAGICVTCASGACFTATAYGDSDLDGRLAVVSYFHPDDAGGSCATMTYAITAPVDPLDGQEIYDQPIDVFTYTGITADDF